MTDPIIVLNQSIRNGGRIMFLHSDILWVKEDIPQNSQIPGCQVSPGKTLVKVFLRNREHPVFVQESFDEIAKILKRERETPLRNSRSPIEFEKSS